MSEIVEINGPLRNRALTFLLKFGKEITVIVGDALTASVGRVVTNPN